MHESRTLGFYPGFSSSPRFVALYWMIPRDEHRHHHNHSDRDHDRTDWWQADARLRVFRNSSKSVRRKIVSKPSYLLDPGSFWFAPRFLWSMALVFASVAVSIMSVEEEGLICQCRVKSSVNRLSAWLMSSGCFQSVQEIVLHTGGLWDKRKIKGVRRGKKKKKEQDKWFFFSLSPKFWLFHPFGTYCPIQTCERAREYRNTRTQIPTT